MLDVFESVLRYNAHKKFVEKTLAKLPEAPSGEPAAAEASTSQATAEASDEVAVAS